MKSFYQKHREIIQYLIIGVCTTLVYMITRFAARSFISVDVVRTIIAQITSILFAFIANKTIVFRNKAHSFSHLMSQLLIFFAGRGVIFVLDIGITYFCITKYASTFIRLMNLHAINYHAFPFSIGFLKNFIGSPIALNEFIITMLYQVFAVVTNYVFSKFFVFKNKKTEKS